MRALLIPILLALIAAIIADSKGHSFFKWFFNGLFFGPLSILYVIFMKRREDPASVGKSQSLIKCPHCNKMIRPDAASCEYCHQKIDIIDV